MSETGAEMKQTLSRVATVREKQEKPVKGSLTAEVKECKGWPRAAPGLGGAVAVSCSLHQFSALISFHCLIKLITQATESSQASPT